MLYVTTWPQEWISDYVWCDHDLDLLTSKSNQISSLSPRSIKVVNLLKFAEQFIKHHVYQTDRLMCRQPKNTVPPVSAAYSGHKNKRQSITNAYKFTNFSPTNCTYATICILSYVHRNQLTVHLKFLLTFMSASKKSDVLAITSNTPDLGLFYNSRARFHTGLVAGNFIYSY